jgi:arylsulfatase A-like enzyme
VNRRTFLQTAGASAAALTGRAVAGGSSPKVRPRQPNVLILQPDQHSAFVTGFAGHPDVLTPHLDRLAAQSTVFTHAVANSPVCSPCRASIQSGLYWHTHGVDANGVRLSPGLPCLADVMSAGGYHTGYIGKWHLDGGDPPDDPGGHIPAGPRRQGWKEWWGYERNHEYRDVFRYDDNGRKVQVEGYDWEPTWHADMTIDFMERHRGDDQPWCFYASFGPPHTPNQCPQEWLDRYNPEKFTLTPAQRKHHPDDERLRHELHYYYAQTSSVDHEVGRILHALETQGLADDTIVLYCSDHGDVLGSHGRLRGKWKPYATAFRIPTMIRWPGQVVAQETDNLIGAPDLPATLVDLAGLSAPVSWQGQSLAPNCRGETQASREALPMGMRGWDGVYDGRYIYSEGNDNVLFDHENDPHELHNLTGSSPELVALKKTQLFEVMEQTGHPEPTRFASSIS